MEKGKYGILQCPGCGEQFPKNSPNMKRCKPCALAAHGQTGSGFKERDCIVCKLSYKPNSAAQKCCPSCKDEYYQRQNALHQEKLRRARGAIPVGTLIPCANCGSNFAYSSGPQVLCQTCCKAKRIKKIREALAVNPSFDEYKARARDNYYFGGNRAKALKRDNHTCQYCGSKRDLQVHHIDGAGTTTPKHLRNNALENLLTLCRGCHTRVHWEMRQDHSY